MINILRRVYYRNKLFKLGAKPSFAQCGEDLIVRYIFRLRNIYTPSYIDIGAHHPFFFSNTALLYENGSTGINIEANPHLIDAFKKHRKKDINLNIGIGNNNDNLDFFVISDPTLSTFSLTEAKAVTKTGKYTISETHQIPTQTIDQVIAKHFNNEWPDFLSLDVEGLDFEILKSINLNAAGPKVICVEAAEYSDIGAGKPRTDILDMLSNSGYTQYATTNLNAIFVRNNFWFIDE